MPPGGGHDGGMKVSDVVTALEDLVPLSLAEAWDNVGLLAGDPEATVQAALLCVDLTPAVLDEAVRQRCSLVIAYHPPIFEGLKRLGEDSLPVRALRAGIALWSPHTALDVADGGTSDVLATALGLSAASPLRVANQAAREGKLVTFVPADAADAVATALFAAGAGVIGQYHSCSFRLAGTGTFFGTDGTHPAVGHRGRLESVEEIRIEMVAPLARLTEIVKALRAAHPYEEPAFDVLALHAPPVAGMGRIGDIAPARPRSAALDDAKKALGLDHLLVAGPLDVPATRGAVAPGSCGDLFRAAIAGGADIYLTGEMRHHDALAATRAGMTVACTLHSNSERAALPRLAERLAARLPALTVLVSAIDRDPFTVR